MELKCAVQHYEWGKIGKESLVYRLATVCGDPPPSEDATTKPHAELWMGTHPKGPSRLAETGELLSSWLQRNLDSLGAPSRERFGDELPFLFKTLSVRKALSVQAHPNLELARKLHEERPDIYMDANHKPEMAVALTPFRAMCGFRPFSEIRSFIRDVPELRAVLGEDTAKRVCEESAQEDSVATETAFAELMRCRPDTVSRNLNALLRRLETANEADRVRFRYDLLKEVSDDFPGDRGCWCIYFLNCCNLLPGEAIYLGPNVPHAYIHGDCVECMALSDNVVRAGLTPKLLDVDTLLSMLDYASIPPEKVVFRPTAEDRFTELWRTDMPDFSLAQIRIPAGVTHNTVIRCNASLLLVTAGSAEAYDTHKVSLTAGSVLYLKASRQLTVTPSQDFVAFQASANVY